MPKSAKRSAPKPTTFTCHAPEAHAVFLAGTFNDWQPNAMPLTRDADGNWTAKLALPPGRHEFKFVIDGNWCCELGGNGDPSQAFDRVPNPFGTENCVVKIKAPLR